MTLKANDLPANGMIKLCMIDGALFEVKRWRALSDGRSFTYAARLVPEVGQPADDSGWSGWWCRFTWKSMLADLRRAAREGGEA